MTQHTHTERVPGCFRCELGRDEAESSMQFEIEDLEAENARLRGALEDVDNVCGEWRRTLDSGRTIDKAGVHGLRLHVQTALGWREPSEVA